MEHIIPSLISDFESEKMTRRQLIQALGLTATAAFAARAVPTAMAEGAGLKATAVNHISYNVPDYARSRDFYSDLLGMKVTYDDGKQCSLTFGSPPNAIYVRKTRQPGDKTNVDHLAYSIASFSKGAVEAVLKRRGLNPRPDGEYAWTIQDPDGFTLQICAEHGVFPGAASPTAKESDGTKNLRAVSRVSGKGFKAIAINHISYNVPDYARSRDFYSDVLGMKVTYDDGKQCYLAFGNDYLFIRKAPQADNKPFVDHLAYTISNWDRDAVEAELNRRGLKPQPDSKFGWTINDPDGYRIQICAKDLPDYVGKTCGGSAQGCPGGPRG